MNLASKRWPVPLRKPGQPSIHYRMMCSLVLRKEPVQPSEISDMRWQAMLSQVRLCLGDQQANEEPIDWTFQAAVQAAFQPSKNNTIREDGPGE